MSSGFAPFETSGFAPFERDPVTVLEEERQRTVNRGILQTSVDNFVREHRLNVLTSDYLNTSTYYYDPHTRMIWEVNWEGVWSPIKTLDGHPFKKPSSDVILHIAALNNLSNVVNDDTQPHFLT